MWMVSETARYNELYAVILLKTLLAKQIMVMEEGRWSVYWSRMSVDHIESTFQGLPEFLVNP